MSHLRYQTEERVHFFDDSGLLREIPLSWTDAVPEDAFLAISQGRSWFRFEDLQELARIIEGLQS